MNAIAIGDALKSRTSSETKVPGTMLSLGAILSGARGSAEAASDTRLPVRIIAQSGVPRWILPFDTRRAVPVLKSWRPYSVKSRMKWSTVVGASRLNLLNLLPGARHEVLSCEMSYWRQWLPDYSESWAIAGYIGNPSPSRKAILFFIDARRRVQAVVKVPILPAAKDAIVHEALVLRKMEQRLPVPGVLFFDEAEGITAQSWVQGVNIPRAFTREHMELLLSLAAENPAPRLAGTREDLERRSAGLSGMIESSLLHRALSLLDTRDELRQCTEHGDFTPWNLRRLRNGELTLIDWEWSVEAGYPWQDVCRYFYMQAYLFDEGANVWNRLISNPLLVEYRRRLELSLGVVRGLTAYFLLRFLCNSYEEGEAGKVAFAAAKIEEILI